MMMHGTGLATFAYLFMVRLFKIRMLNRFLTISCYTRVRNACDADKYNSIVKTY